MIKVIFFRNNGKIFGFEIKNHGKDIVCSAVSILSLNTVNSIDAFTDIKFNVDYNQNGGFLKFFIDRSFDCEKANLLLKSLELGLKGIEFEYSKEISIKYKEVL